MLRIPIELTEEALRRREEFDGIAILGHPRRPADHRGVLLVERDLDSCALGAEHRDSVDAQH